MEIRSFDFTSRVSTNTTQRQLQSRFELTASCFGAVRSSPMIDMDQHISRQWHIAKTTQIDDHRKYTTSQHANHSGSTHRLRKITARQHKATQKLLKTTTTTDKNVCSTLHVRPPRRFLAGARLLTRTMPVTADDCPICTLKMIMPTAVTACGHKFCFLCIKGVALLNNGNHSLCPMCRGPVDIRQFTHVTDRNLQITMQDPEDDAPKTPPPAKLVPILTIKKEIKSEPQDREYTEPQQADNKDGVHKLPAQTVLQKQKEMDTTAMSTSAQKPNTIYWVYRARSNGWWRYDPRSEKDIEAARRLGKLSCEVVTCGMTFVVDFQNMKQFRKDRPDIERDIARIDGDQCLAGMNIRGIAGVSLS